MKPQTPASFHPLSPGQQALWFLYQMAPESVAYNIFDTAVIRSSIDITALQRAWQKIVDRHPILRTTYTTYEEEPFQIVQKQPEIYLQVTDASNWSEDGFKKQILLETDRPFNLEKELPWRLNIFTRSRQVHILLLTMHHIASDSWSYDLLFTELQLWYAAETEQISSQQLEDSLPRTLPYTDFVRWQSEMLSGPKGEKLWESWQKQLSGELPILNLPTDRPRPPVQTYRGETHIFKLDEQLIQGLREVASSTGASLYKLMLAAFFVLLYRYTNQEDILVGSPMLGRPGREFKGVVGYFVNPVVLRATVTGDLTFKDFLVRVSSQVKEAQKYQDYPFPLLVEKLQPQRDPSRSPLFQVSFTWQKQRWCESVKDSSRLQKPGLEMVPYPLGHQRGASFDLDVMVMEMEEVLLAGWQYNTDLFDEATIARMAGHFQTLLSEIVANPEQPISALPMLTETERQQLHVEWNSTAKDYPQDKCVHQLFEEQVERAPDAVALVFEGEQLTYRELNRRANQLAHYLQSLGVGPDVLVGLCVERSFEMIVGILGVLKAGGAYVPLDPAYPQERLAFMLEDSSVPVLLTQTQLVELLPPNSARVVCLDGDIEKISSHSSDNPSSSVTPDNLAYIIYTSGSTGKPKGVLLAHSGLCNLATAQIHLFGVQPDSRILQFASFSFDVATSDVVIALGSGATLYLATKDSILPGAGLIEVLRDKAITHVDLPVSVLSVLPFEELPALQTIVVGGEACPPDLVARWAGERQFFNAYGPTEATVSATVALCCDGSQKPPIGRPIANTQVYILDTHNQPVPIGVPGELHISGVGLAKGYLNRPDLTEAKFVSNPFNNEPGSRLYKTGDLARYLPDGNIEYLGRIDNQVKVRGFRIEPGEIEAVLNQHPGVRETAVIARDFVTGDKQLVAYVVPDQEPAPAISDLRRFLKEKLPDYMVPGAFVMLDALPLTPNGKVDRRALPAPDPIQFQLQNNFVAPRTPIEEILAEIWAQVLGLQRVGIFDNFFELGGHSLKATQVISRVRQTFQMELPLRSLFASPTIAGLALSLESARREALGLQVTPIQPVSRNQDLPLSFAQQRLWFLDRLVPNSSLYNVPEAFRLSGNLNVAALERSLDVLVKRHEILRTTFTVADGFPVLAIAPKANFTLPVVDLRELPEGEREAKALKRVTEAAGEPFYLEVGPLLRCQLFQLNEEEYIFLVAMHHIITDGWSMGVFFRELTALYEAFSAGATSPLQELPVQYADFAVWQQQWLLGEIIDGQLAYWKQQLAGAPAVLNLPTDRPRPSEQTFRGAIQPFSLPEPLSKALLALSHRQSATLFMTLLAAFQTLLYRLSGQDDIVVGSPIANRHIAEIEGLIGFFINTLVLRTDLSGHPTFEELLGRVREVALGAYAHQDLPFEQLVEALQPERSLSHTPLFQVMFALEDTGVPSVELPDVTVNPLAVETRMANFDLTLSMENTASGLMGVWEYNTDLFDGATIARMSGHFQTLLEAIAANPKHKISELPLLTPTEGQQLLVEWNSTAKDYPQDKCVHQLFEVQVERAPDAVALVFEGEQLTYRELNRRANQLAHYLQSLGVGPDVLVGLCVERSFEMIVGILGVLKAGGAYVPLDPAYPQERLAFMLEDSSVPVLLTQQKLVEKLPPNSAHVVCLDSDWEAIAAHSESNPSSGVKPENLAYVIYTSGSTGKPKGVLIEHRSLVNYTTAASAEYGIEECDRVLQFASISFDASAEEIYTCLTSGATLVLRTDSLLDSVGVFLQKCSDFKITILALPTAYWHELTAILSQEKFVFPPSIRLVSIGGEKAIYEKLKSWIERVGQQVRLVNVYGPTEATVGATICELSAADATLRELPIGRPIANVETYILDRNGQLVPIGVAGELHIGGAGLARGYLNRPDLTAEKFIANPFADFGLPQNPKSNRLYKTGDLARYLPDGNIELIGRTDTQVKIRGFRIELAEIEAVLCKHPQVRESAVVVREDAPGSKRLVAYTVAHRHGIEAAPNELRQFLQERLPEYMVPSAFVLLEELPLTPNGKVDRRALPAPDSFNFWNKTCFVAPRDPLELQLSQIWSEVLGVYPVGVQDNFFTSGGHSLLAVRLMARLEQQFGQNLSLATLFSSPTIEQLAIHLRSSRDSGKWSPLIPIQSNGYKRPFFCVPGAGGNVLYFNELARHLGSDRPFYGLQARGLDGESKPFTQVEDMAACYIEAIQTVQSQGPYLLGGHSFGGLVAFEIAQQLQKQGHEVAVVAIIDTVAPILSKNSRQVNEYQLDYTEFASYMEYMFDPKWELSKEAFAFLSQDKQLDYLKERWSQFTSLPKDVASKSFSGLMEVYNANTKAHCIYCPQQVLPTRISVFRASEIDTIDAAMEELCELLKDPALGWSDFSTTKETYVIPGNHMTVMQKPHVQVLAAHLKASLELAQVH